MSSRRRRRGGNSFVGRLQDLLLAPVRMVLAIYYATIGRLFSGRRRRRRSSERRNPIGAFFQTLIELIIAPFTITFRLLWFIAFDWAPSRSARPILLGLPALIVAISVISLIAYAFSKPDEKVAGLYAMRAQRIMRNAGSNIIALDDLSLKSDEEGADDAADDEDDIATPVSNEGEPSEEQLRTAALFLQKAVKLAPNNEAYKFSLARVSAEIGDIRLVNALTNTLAPLPMIGDNPKMFSDIAFSDFEQLRDADDIELYIKMQHYLFVGQQFLKTGDEKKSEADEEASTDGNEEAGMEAVDDAADDVANEAKPPENRGVTKENLYRALLYHKAALVINEQISETKYKNPQLKASYTSMLVSGATALATLGVPMPVTLSEIEKVLGGATPSKPVDQMNLARIHRRAYAVLARDIAIRRQSLANSNDVNAAVERQARQDLNKLEDAADQHRDRSIELADTALETQKQMLKLHPGRSPNHWAGLAQIWAMSESYKGTNRFEDIVQGLQQAYPHLDQQSLAAMRGNVEVALLLQAVDRDLAKINQLQARIAAERSKLNGDVPVEIAEEDAILNRIDSLELESEPLRAAVVSNLGEVLRRNAQDPRALAKLTAIYSRPDFTASSDVKAMVDRMVVDGQATPFAHYLRGNIAAHEKEWKAARYHLEQAVSLNGKFGPALNNLAYVLLNDDSEEGRPERLELALQAINEAIALEQPGTYFDTRGRVYMELGRWNEALSDFEKAKEDMKFKPEFFENMAKCFDKLGMDDMRDLHLEKASQLKSAAEGS